MGMSLFSMIAASVAAYGVYDNISQAVTAAEERRKNDPGSNPPANADRASPHRTTPHPDHRRGTPP